MTHPKKPAAHLYESINILRLTAAVMYDKSVAAGATPETVKKNIDPITQQMEELCHDALIHDLPGLVFAIKSIERDAAKHMQDADFLLEKATSSKRHAHALRKSLKDHMEKHGSTEAADGDTFVTLVNGELTLR